ncbi:hypothetical protein DL764_007694 [Monosporascus ibericus]|uniref:Uncharacterized protein n=1 Tax=Monosporascus ibericus TaxID=155417 RepID=A0A4Q4SZF0_9PEZI|nr:hypothetical protein DL764_007694 [Monosporascus ibericus]
MQLTNLLVTFLLSLGILALPAPEEAVGVRDADSELEISAEAVEAVGFSDNSDEPSKLFARDRVCTINGSGRVNCRTCASTSCSAPYYVNGGSRYNFDCAVYGDCVTIGGVRNCVWQRLVREGCYVSGYYTDAGCTYGN